ncbi:hypothetical protein BU15DRAFT_75465 [Melanogaster broomeanus]|nr:hypothetical protein BU15DRAFT_75465 [Melanogaster broomeanus]
MTRTERAAFPRALIRDRSESKSGFDKSLRKHGSGHHNWGSVADEGYLEAAALADEADDLADDEDRKDVEKPNPGTPVVERRSNSLTEEEKLLAGIFRQTALKSQDINLSDIARTSHAASVSPPGRVAIVPGADMAALGHALSPAVNDTI